MDELTRYFISTSQRLRYLLHSQDYKENASDNRNQCDSDTEQDSTESLDAGDHFDMDESDSHKEEGAYETYAYLQEFKQRFTKQLRKPKFVLGLFGFLVLVAYTYFTAQMYCANKKSADAAKGAADTAREALVVGQRAFIVDSFMQKQEGQFMKIIVRLENTGQTPTRYMITHMSQSGLMHTPLPDDFAFPNTWNDGKDHGGIQVTVPAKGSVIGIEMLVPIAELQKLPSHMYVWGWATYYDAFENTPQHIMRFCEDFSVYSGSYVHSIESSNACYRHNCIDNECK